MAKPPSRPDHAIERIVAELEGLPGVTLTSPPRWQDAALRPAVTGGRPRVGRWGLRFLASGACALAIGLAVFAVVSGSSTVERAAALPVLERPAVDASKVRSATTLLSRHGASYAKARAIDTPKGRGYVMTADNGNVCLAIPDDPGAGFGQSCATQAQINRRGLYVALVSPRGSTMVAVVPRGTTDAKIHMADGSTKPLDIADGVIVAEATGRGSVSFQIGSRHVSVSLAPKGRCVLPNASLTPAEMADVQRTLGVPICTDIPKRPPRPPMLRAG